MRAYESGTTSNKNIALKCHINIVFLDNQITNQHLSRPNGKNLSPKESLFPLVSPNQFLKQDHSRQ